MRINVIAFSVVIIGACAGFLLLWFKLQRQLQSTQRNVDDLWKKIETIQHDVSALCSGARGVDERVGGNEKRVKGLLDRLEDLEDNDTSSHIQEFQNATKLAQEGASAKEIVEKCNLTIDEAGLLIRLHQTGV